MHKSHVKMQKFEVCDLSYKYAQTIKNILICLTKHGAQLPNARHTHV
jgi:hypothetical protein